MAGERYLSDEEWLLKRLKKLLKRFRVPILSSFGFGFAAHMFVFTDKLANWDEIMNIFGKGTTVSSGRWGLRLCSYIFPDYSMPWLWGIISLALLSAAICLIIETFRIKSRILRCLLAGCIVTFPSVVSIFAYMFTSTSYMLAVLLAVIPAYLLSRINYTFSLRRRVLYVIAALASLTMCCGIYQAFISVTASLLVVLVIRDLLYSEDLTFEVVVRGLWYVGFLLLGVACYAAVTGAVAAATGIGFNSYARDHMLSGEGLFARIGMLLRGFAGILFRERYGIISGTPARVIHVALIISGAIIAVLGVNRRRMTVVRILLCVICLLLFFPLSVNCASLLNPGYSHTIMYYGFAAVYVLLAAASDAAGTLSAADIRASLMSAETDADDMHEIDSLRSFDRYAYAAGTQHAADSAEIRAAADYVRAVRDSDTARARAALRAERAKKRAVWTRRIFRGARLAAVIGLALTACYFVFFANRAYLKLEVRTNADLSFYTRLAARIEEAPDYTEGVKVAIIGSAVPERQPPDVFDMPNLVGFNVYVSRKDLYAPTYLREFLRIDMDFAGPGELRAIAEDSAFREMPCYPYQGSVQRIGEYLVVRLGEQMSWQFYNYEPEYWR